MTELSKHRTHNMVIAICALIIVFCLSFMVSSCNSNNDDSHLSYENVTVLSTLELPKQFLMNFQSRVMTKDSVVYCYYTNEKFEPGDKIKLPFQGNKIFY